MSWLLLDDAGELLAIYNSPVDGALEVEVPAEYPERFSWDPPSRSFVQSIEKLRAQKRSAVEQKLAEAVSSGFTPNRGPCAGKLLQTRNADDRQNWLTAKDIFRDKRDAGEGAQQGALIRTASNEIVSCTFDEGFATLQAMADWGLQVMGVSWSLKDQIDAATSADAIAAIDITAGWP